MKYVFARSKSRPIEHPDSLINLSGSIVALRSTHISNQSIALLRGIPPERVGLDGEYDHAGLAKRVRLTLCQHLGASIVDCITISQRGRVVILVGAMLSAQLVQQLVELSLSAEGAAFVEVHDLHQLQSDAA